MAKKIRRRINNLVKLGFDVNQATSIAFGGTADGGIPGQQKEPASPPLPEPTAPIPPPIKTKTDTPRIRSKKSRRQSLGIGRRSRSQTRVLLNSSSGSKGGINL